MKGEITICTVADSPTSEAIKVISKLSHGEIKFRGTEKGMEFFLDETLAVGMPKRHLSGKEKVAWENIIRSAIYFGTFKKFHTRIERELKCICAIPDPMTGEAIKIIARLSRDCIRFRASEKGIEFLTYLDLDDNDRRAWEQLIRGIVFLK